MADQDPRSSDSALQNEARNLAQEKAEAGDPAPLGRAATDADDNVPNDADSPAASEPSAQLDDRAWLRSIWRPLLITILAGCLVVAFLAFARRIFPGLPIGYSQSMVAIGLISAASGCVSTTWLAQPAQRGSRSAGYRTAEFVFLIVLTRVAAWAATGTWPGFDLVLRPVDSLLDGYFIVGLIAVFLAWFMASTMTDDMIEMGLRPDDIYMARDIRDKWQDTARPVYTDRPAILRRFTSRWVVGGILLVVMAAGSRFAAPEPGFFLPIIGQNIDRTVIGAVIVYFLVGLALISQGQLALLRARWTLQKTPSAPGVLRNWPIYVLVLIVAAGFVSALLPLGGTFHLAMILSAVIGFSYWLMMQIFGTILGFFLLLASLFAGEEQAQPTPTPAPMPTFTPQPTPESAVELPPWAGGTVFWILAAALLGYAAYIYFGGRGISFAWLHQLWQMLRNRWDHLRMAYQDWQATHVRDEDTEDKPAARRRKLMSWFGYRGLAPDAQVRYYYLSILEQAEQAGRPRHRSETPYGYAPRLVDQITRSKQESATGEARDPDQDDTTATAGDESNGEADLVDRGAVFELTDAFVRVRYADRHFDAAEAKRLRESWNRLKRLLRM